MDFGQVDILDVVCAIVVLDLTARPVHAFNLDRFAILDRAGNGDCTGSRKLASPTPDRNGECLEALTDYQGANGSVESVSRGRSQVEKYPREAYMKDVLLRSGLVEAHFADSSNLGFAHCLQIKYL